MMINGSSKNVCSEVRNTVIEWWHAAYELLRNFPMAAFLDRQYWSNLVPRVLSLTTWREKGPWLRLVT